MVSSPNPERQTKNWRCAFLRATKITHRLKPFLIGFGKKAYADPAKHADWNATDGGTDADPQGDEYGRPFPVDGAHIPRSQKRLSEPNQLEIIVPFGQRTQKPNEKKKTNKKNALNSNMCHCSHVKTYTKAAKWIDLENTLKRADEEDVTTVKLKCSEEKCRQNH